MADLINCPHPGGADPLEPKIFAIAERILAANTAPAAVLLAQEIVDLVADAAMPLECPEEAGKVGWQSRWSRGGKNRYKALREALRADSPGLFGGL